MPAEIETSKASMRILLLINGERTLAEVLLHARGSEYLVTKFLYELHRKRLIEVTGLRPLDPAPADSPPATEENGERHEPDLAGELYVASRLMARNELDAALAVLNAAARAFPGAPSVRQMIGRAEEMYQDRAGEEFPPEKIPVVVKEGDYLRDQALSPGEAFLLTLIDGASDIKSILWIAPMRSVEVLQTIKTLLDKKIIRLS